MSKVKSIFSIIFIMIVYGAVESSANPFLYWWWWEIWIVLLHMVCIVILEIWVMIHFLWLNREMMVCALSYYIYILNNVWWHVIFILLLIRIVFAKHVVFRFQSWSAIHSLYGLYGPRCPLYHRRPINLVSLPLSIVRQHILSIEIFFN